MEGTTQLKRTLLIATGNPGKVETLRRLLQDLPFNLVGLDTLPNIKSVEETGQTFEENSRLKACGYADQSGLLTLADDSGLEVAALGGGPGIYSARYGGPGLTEAERCVHLLSNLEQVPEGQRQAQFVCVVTIANPRQGVCGEFRGVSKGYLLTEMRGNLGFGYDPLFVPEGESCSYAELGPAVKDKLGHRYKAMHAARGLLTELARSLGP